MVSQHPLIKRAKKYLRKDVDLSPPGCFYSDSIGAWCVTATGDLLVETPNHQGTRTKKNDIETGEDQKGE